MRRNILIILVIFSALVLFLKLFTAEVMHREDPTIGVIIKFPPSLQNKYQLSGSKGVTDHITLITDENGYIGEEVYKAIVTWLWFVVPFATILYWHIIIKIEKGSGVNLK